MYLSDPLPATHTPLWWLIVCNWTETAQEILAELFSELGPNDAVDEQVSRGVDHKEHMGYESNKNTPNGETPKKGILAEFN